MERIYILSTVLFAWVLTFMFCWVMGVAEVIPGIYTLELTRDHNNPYASTQAYYLLAYNVFIWAWGVL